MKIINFRVSDDEHALMHSIAEHEGLNLTAYIRRHFILQARELKLTTNNSAGPTPNAPTTPMRNDVLAREALLRRVDSGQQLREVAASVGIQVSELQARLAQAKTARADGSLQRTLDIQAFMLDNPKPDGGKEYTLVDRPALDGAGRVFSWEERITTVPTAPQPTHALTLEEENNERGRMLMLAMEGTPVQVAPRMVDPDAVGKLDGLFD